MSASRVSFIPSTILTTSTAALAGSNGSVTFLNKPLAGQPGTLLSSATFKLALPRSSTSGQGSQLNSVNIAYTIEESDITSVAFALSTQSFGPGSVVTAVPTTPSGFTLTPGSYTGVLTVDTPSYANGANPEYLVLDVTVVVDTSMVTELRINDVELVYQENVANSLPNNVNIPGYLNVGSAGPPPKTNPGDLTTVRAFVGNPAAPIFDNNQSLTVQQDVTFSFAPIYNILAIQRPQSANINGNFHNVFVITDSTNAPTNVGLMTGVTARAIHNSVVNCGNIASVNCGGSVGGGFQSPATIGTINGILVRNSYNADGSIATGNISNVFGVHITDQSPSSLGTVTQFSALEIDPIFSTQTTNAAIRIGSVNNGTSANYGIWFNSNNANSGSGIAFGTSGDTIMYRGGASQLLTPGDWMTKHYLSSTTPTLTPGTGAGTTPTGISITGSDHGFTVIITTGLTPAVYSPIFTVTFGASWYVSAPSVVWCGGNHLAESMAVTARPFVFQITTTQFVFMSNVDALTAATQYVFQFVAMR